MRHREQSDSLVEECMVTMSRNTSIDSSAPGCEGSRRSSLLIQDARETLSLKSRDGTPTSQFVSPISHMVTSCIDLSFHSN